jgi:glutamate/tyrosine decarboxylase-like PLP-dependent enzyme
MQPPLPHAPLLEDAAGRSVAYLASLADRRVFPDAAALARLAELDVPLPEAPTDPRAVLARLDALGSPGTIASAGGRYFGYVIGGSHPAALAAHWLATAWDQNAVFQATSPAAAALERVAMRWVIEALRLPAEHRGGFVTGTTMGHVAALAAARHAVLQRAGWDVERDGLCEAPRITVVAGTGAHGTLDRALRIVGLGTGSVVRVPTDRCGRMRADALPKLSGPAIVCAQLGHVDGGACDDLVALSAAARAAGAWLHVDGAFGLWARAAPSRAHLAEGLEDADSCAGDLHKWLNVPYDNGVCLVRGANVDALRAALAMTGAYFPDDTVHDPGRWTPDASRRARGVDAWAVMAALGRTGIADLVERTCAFARRFAEGLGAAGHEVLNEVVLNQVVVAFGSDARTRAVIRAIQDDGTCWCSGTTWHGRAAMRISVSSWATTADDVERSLAAMLRCARATA